MSQRMFRPVSAPVRWLADVGQSLDPVIRDKFEASFFRSYVPIIAGGLNGIIIDLLASFRLNNSLLIAIAAFDLLTIILRVLSVVCVKRSNYFVDVLFLSGVAWCISQAIALTIVFQSHDLLLVVVFGSSIVATAAGIASRNFGAPRFATVQILILDIAFKTNIIFFDWRELGPVALMQGTFFLFVNLSLISGLRHLTIRALEGEVASRKLAARDPLTGLQNRRGLEEASNISLGPFSVFVIDLDGFKAVNDLHGHAAGDVILKGVAARLTTMCPDALSTCRLGGDEFIVLFDGLNRSECEAVAARIVMVLSAPYRLHDSSLVSVGASVGVAHAADGPVEWLMAEADRALYVAKTAGKGCYIFAELPGSASAFEVSDGSVRRKFNSERS